MTARESLPLTGTSSGGGSCCGHTPRPEATTKAPADDMAECPVMAGTPVVKAQAEEAGLYRDHRGTRHWFCCAACGPLFDADPEQYAHPA
ncbi:hypothetical protein Q7C18_16495 [Nesterenkonia sp. CL21]|uniref:hypothetical protein n=1 Tax=Nesterenkonia sp. CL21 TaxID=3064894 RepID=UPI0028787A88|nr:hypothetical protein [Nesterenkonia sp. CL21]MDS2174302.1 hypothetical protein [Nesterenkonia sp. CL21]